jgi:hypothetical protein
MRFMRQLPTGGSAPATPGFNAVAPEWLMNYGAAFTAPAIPAAESTLGFHPWRALSSAQVLPEWINYNLAGNRLAANGDNPLNFVSRSRGSLHLASSSPCRAVLLSRAMQDRSVQSSAFRCAIMSSCKFGYIQQRS